MAYKNLPKEHQAFHDFSNLSEGLKGYWAGILDGEGCLRMDACSGKPLPYITLIMTCEKTVNKFAETFGGNVRMQNRNGMAEHWKDCYCAKTSTHKAAKMCEALLPYFITKSEIAKEMAEFYVHACEICSAKFWQFNGINTCSDECQRIRKNRIDCEYRLKKKGLV
jgi:hypothetical protein